MKNIAILLFSIMLLPFISAAQRPDRPNMDPKEMANRTVTELSQKITITPAIQDSIKVTFLNFFDEMKKERESGNRPDRAVLESKRDAKIKTFLTDEQYKAYIKFMEERKAMRGRPGDGGPRGRN